METKVDRMKEELESMKGKMERLDRRVESMSRNIEEIKGRMQGVEIVIETMKEYLREVREHSMAKDTGPSKKGKALMEPPSSFTHITSKEDYTSVTNGGRRA